MESEGTGTSPLAGCCAATVQKLPRSRRLRTGAPLRRPIGVFALAASVVALWSSAAFAGGATTSGGKMSSPSSVAVKSGEIGVRQPGDVRVVRGVHGIRRFGSGGFEGPSFLIVDAMPLHAQVVLDGRPLGSAAELIARAFRLAPGRHIVQVVAPGFKAHIAPVVADPTFPTRLRIVLSQE